MSGPCCLFKPSQNPNTVLGVKCFLIRSGIVTESCERTACYRLIRRVHIENVFRLSVEHPVDFLSAIYNRKYTEVASHFGLQTGALNRDSASLGLPKTRLLSNAKEEEVETVSLPVEFKPGFRFERTNLLARVVEKWDEVPVGLLQHLDLRKSMYGYVGLEDFTLFPIIRPGSLVQIDASQRKISIVKWTTEYERPIYFTELREGYVCSWCEVDRGQLLIIPHPQSRREVRRFDYPSQAEIVGRVTGVTMRIVGERSAERRDTSREK